MIEVQSLTRRYGKTTAVDEVSFQINDNEIVGLLGHNGAGKTTIMRMLSGYLEPSAGTILIDGVDLAADAHIVQQQLGYLPENLPLYPEMMVADYLDYAATCKGIPTADRPPAVRQAIMATDLASRALDPISTLSRGLKQRVGVAQAILGEPRLLILDEPTNGLDPNQTGQMRQLIRQLSRQATVILSTHIMQEVDAICDRVLVLRNGRLALDQRLAVLHHSKTLLLRTSSGTQSLESQLAGLPQIAAIRTHSSAAGVAQFALTLQGDADLDTTADSVARCVVSAGARLHQLQPVVRDLESVFREVNSVGQ